MSGHLRVRLVGLLALLALSHSPACEPQAASPLTRVAPGVPAELLSAFAEEGGATVGAWVEHAGASTTKRAIYELLGGISIESPEEFERTRAIVRGPALRLAVEADRRFDVGLERRTRQTLDFSLQEQTRRRELTESVKNLEHPGLTAEERETRLRELLEANREFGDGYGELPVLSALADRLADLNRREEALVTYRRGLARARELDERWAELQFLGVVGHYHEQAAELDSMRACWSQGIELADRSRIAEQGARFRVFLANHYAIHGRYAIARELFDEADRSVRDPSGSLFAVRLTQRLLEFHATLRCWEVVDRLLERQEEILASLPADLHEPYRALYVLRRDRVAARRAMARGDVETADRIWDRTLEVAREHLRREELADLLLYRGRGYLEHDRPACALLELEEGLAYAAENNLPTREIRFRALNGLACAGIGDLRSAHVHFSAFAGAARSDELRYAREWAAHDAAQIRLASQRGAREEAEALLEQGIERARRIARATDPSGAGYLLLEELDEIWRAGDEGLRDDPERSFEHEMSRRLLRCELGANASGRSVPAVCFGPDERRALVASLAEKEAACVTWRVRDDAIDVWMVTPDGVSRTVAPADPPTARARVEELVDAIARAASDATEVAARVGDALFPAEAWAALQGRRLVLLSPDSFVSLAPLELIPDETGRALVDAHDVALLRFVAALPIEPAAGPPLVIGAPALPPEVVRRWPRLSRLEGATSEAALVAQLLGDAVRLDGAGATKGAILEHWEDAPIVHLSAHFVRDPLVPFVTFVPLAAPPGADREQSYLDVLDVRLSCFDSTSLVVLSGCGSGAPWVGTVTAPGLGEAFLDAGAAAVVQTRWEIDDSVALDLMTSFARRCASGESPVAALNAVKRAAKADGVAPFQWAAYSVELSRI